MTEKISCWLRINLWGWWVFFLYLVVGSISTLIEWIIFYILNRFLNWYYFISTSLAFIVSTFVNLFLGKSLVFKNTHLNLIEEIAKIYIASLVGLFLNLVIMFFLINKFSISNMYAKILASAIVFLWNFLIRRLAIYKV